MFRRVESGIIPFKTLQDPQKGIDAPYNTTTGKFICKQSGIYIFSFSITPWKLTPISRKHSLIRNGEIICSSYTMSSGEIGCTASVKLAVTDEVYVQIDDETDLTLGSSFTGTLIRPTYE